MASVNGRGYSMVIAQRRGGVSQMKSIFTLLLFVAGLPIPAGAIHLVSSATLTNGTGETRFAWDIKRDGAGIAYVIGTQGRRSFALKLNSSGVAISSAMFQAVSGGSLTFRSAAIEPSGDIVLFGEQSDGANDAFVLARIDNSLQLISSTVVRGMPPAGDFKTQGFGVAVGTDSVIYGVGTMPLSSGMPLTWLGRFNPDLRLSSAVTAASTSGGQPMTEAQGIWYSVAITSDNKVAVGGLSYNPPNQGWNVWRYHSSLDFNGGLFSGSATALPLIDAPFAVTAATSGPLVSAGARGFIDRQWSSSRTVSGHMIVQQYNPPGSTGDFSFTDFGPGASPPQAVYSKANDVLIDRVGRLWVVGTRDDKLAIFQARVVRKAFAERFTTTSTLMSAVQGIAETSSGNMWTVGTDTSTGHIEFAEWEGPPSIVAGISSATFGSSSMTWSWSVPSVFPTTSYMLLRSSDLAQISTSATPTFTISNLAPDSIFSMQVAGVNEAGEGQLSAPVTGYTLAEVPASPQITTVGLSSLTISWSQGANHSGVRYQVFISTGPSPESNGLSGNVSVTTTALVYEALGLLTGSTYYATLRALNQNGIASGSVLLGPTKTTGLAPPSGVSVQVLGASSVTWSWGAVAAASGFRVVSTAGISLSGDLASSATFWTETSLVANTAYARQIIAFGPQDASTSSAVSIMTFAATPDSLAFDLVFTSSLTLSWATNTNPLGTTYRYTIWETVAGSSTLTTTASSATLTGLVGGATYFVTLEALNGDSVVTRGPPAASTSTLPGGASAPGEVIVIQLPSGRATVDVPTTAFPPGVTVTVEPPGPLPAPAGGTGMAGTGVGVRITASGSAQPQERVSIGLPYRDADVAGLDLSRLLLARYDEGRRVWVPLDSRVDTAGKRVTGSTDHFSLFQIMQTVAANGLSAPKAFPNPLRPSLGHTAVTFVNLPAGSRVRVYTLVGELVRDLTASGAGLASWDGKNASGVRVASGVYAVFIQGGGESTTIKVAVQR